MRTDTELLEFMMKHWEGQEFGETFGWRSLRPEEFRKELNEFIDEFESCKEP